MQLCFMQPQMYGYDRRHTVLQEIIEMLFAYIRNKFVPCVMYHGLKPARYKYRTNKKVPLSALLPSGLLSSSLKALSSFLHSAQNSTMACALWTNRSSSVSERPAVLHWRDRVKKKKG